MTKLGKILEVYEKGTPSIGLDRTFYFDETNNVLKGAIGETCDNNADLEKTFFVLVGIATKAPLNFDDLLEYIGARQTPVDVKYGFFVLKHKRFSAISRQ